MLLPTARTSRNSCSSGSGSIYTTTAIDQPSTTTNSANTSRTIPAVGANSTTGCNNSTTNSPSTKTTGVASVLNIKCLVKFNFSLFLLILVALRLAEFTIVRNDYLYHQTLSSSSSSSSSSSLLQEMEEVKLDIDQQLLEYAGGGGANSNGAYVRGGGRGGNDSGDDSGDDIGVRIGSIGNGSDMKTSLQQYDNDDDTEGYEDFLDKFHKEHGDNNDKDDHHDHEDEDDDDIFDDDKDDDDDEKDDDVDYRNSIAHRNRNRDSGIGIEEDNRNHDNQNDKMKSDSKLAKISLRRKTATK